jgi:murein DD-endopeptidase MepM/ murein hydrolase activator NlpD
MDIRKPIEFVEDHRFSFVSWGATSLLVVALLGSTLWWTQYGSVSAASRPQPTAAPSQKPNVGLPASGANSNAAVPSIGRALDLKTDLKAQASTKPVTYKVEVGDSVFGIAKQYDLKPESILYSNESALNDNPTLLSPGMTLTIPPVDGLLYTWKEGDTIEKVADQFKSDLNADKKIDAKDATLLADAILNFPGNNLDLTDPVIKPGQVLMIPGGQRELIAWLDFVPTYNRQGSGAGTSELSPSGCNVGFGSPPGLWPTAGPHTVSGNGYSPSHQGIDITASMNMAVLASGSGVVVFVGWSQYGYGNVIQIDHGDGFSTVYAHLNGFNVSQCQTVQTGQVIGYAGSTGNSTGVHLHFEVRNGGASVDPWGIVH